MTASVAGFCNSPQLKTDTSQLRLSHSTRVKECSMERSEVITSVQRHRRYSGQEEAQFVAMTIQSGSSISSVARQYGISPSLLFKWKRLMQDGGVTAVEANDQVISVSDYN
ncbi:hypothetical protein C9426_16880 [Serratia sp. S1B]|nr:hypothetical protein C9426_16880 [Serratia sp. S1B]